MTEDKNKRQPPPEIEILNPRYKGATLEMVGGALLKNSKKNYSVKYGSQMIAPESCCPPCRVLRRWIDER